MEIIDEIKELINCNSSNDSKTQHLIYVFEGYRSNVIYGDNVCPYSPGSARADSWQIGYQMAKKDVEL